MWACDYGQALKFFCREPVNFERRAPAPNYKPAVLGGVRDFVMCPVVNGLCKMESIYDGSLSLADFALMNDALALRAENEHRAREAAKKDER